MRDNEKYASIVDMSNNDIQFKDKLRDYYLKISDLEAKLAEKEKEIKILTKQNKTLVEEEDLLDKKLKELGVDCIEDLGKETNKAKAEFAIQQLQRVKELCDKEFDRWENSEYEGNLYDKFDVANAYLDVSANIEEIIKELEGK